jgi:hypothetical protein
MAQRVAGIVKFTVDGNQMAVRGNCTISPSVLERTMLAGQDGIHGYQELPRVPYFEADFTTMPGFQVLSLLTQTDVTVIIEGPAGLNYQLTNATCKDAIEINTRDGQYRARWEGLACREYS